MTATTVRPGALTALLAELARAPEAAGWELPAVPGEKIGRFEIVRELGRGGFGVVYEARDVELGRSVAFKAARAGSSDAAREQRALAEAEAAARLAHPNIVHLYDVGRCERGPYLIMELLRGEALDERLARGALPLREAVRIAAEIARGVAHAHGQGVVHRDLKPANVFVCEDGQVKVLDFGLAHVFGRGGPMGGTPAYMAPEQAAGEPGDERADVYSLGMVVRELVPSGAPPALARLLERMGDRDPAGRPASAADVLAQLAAVQRALEPRRLLWVAWATAALAVVVAGGLWLRSHPLPPGRLLTAMADAENRTGDRDLDETAALLGSALEQSKRVSLVARSRLAALLRAARGTVPARIDEPAAREVARRIDARTLIVPAVRRAGEAYEVEARAVDLSRDEPLFILRERASSKTGVPEAVDRLSDRVRRELREAPEEAPERPVRIARAVSESPEAMRAYWEGKRLGASGRAREAVSAYERAVAADPEFPLAHAELAALAAFFDEATMERHFDAAIRFSDRLPPKDRLLLQARRARLHGRFDEALELYDRVIAAWPQEPTAYLRAGFILEYDLADAPAARPYLEKALEVADLSPERRVDTLVALGRLDDARDAAVRWAADAPGVPSYANLSRVHRLRGDLDAALETARRVASLGTLPGASEGGPARSEQAFWSFVEAGALDEVEQLYGRRGLRSWEALALRGRLREAIAALDADARSGVAAGVPIAEAPVGTRAVYRALRGSLWWGTGDADRTWRDVEEMLRLGASAAQCFAPALADLGDRDRAERLMSLWAGLADPRMYCPRLYRYVRAWKEGDLDGAARGLATMAGPEPAYRLGAVLGELQRDEEAVEAFRRFRRDPAYNMEGTNVVAYPRSLYLEAVSLERLGRLDEARAATARLLRLWERADPDLEYLREARALGARLTARSR